MKRSERVIKLSTLLFCGRSTTVCRHCCHAANGSEKNKVAYYRFPIPMLHLVSGDIGLFRGAPTTGTNQVNHGRAGVWLVYKPLALSLTASRLK